jgi:RHS repeat-associated protein
MRLTRLILVGLLVVAASFPVHAQIPCTAITRNPQLLELLVEVQAAAERVAEAHAELEQALKPSDFADLRFGPVALQPGDALYVEYKGRDFSILAHYRSGDITAFDSSPKGSFEEWRKAAMLLDHRLGVNQELVRLSVEVHGAASTDPLFRNFRIIRAGRPLVEFTSLSAAPLPTRVASRGPLPCVAFDQQPAPPAQFLPAVLTTPLPAIPTPSPAAAALPRQMMTTMMPLVQGGGGSSENNYKFTGKEFDPESGLYNFGARYYSPTQGRFTSTDQGPLREYDPQSLNRYAYARNNPLRYIDQDGNYWVEAVNIAGLTEYRVFRETSWLVAEATSKSWGKGVDYASRRQRGDTNQPGLLPGRGFLFEQDRMAGLEQAERYSLREGIQLDQRVFTAFSKEFNVPQQERGPNAFMTLTHQQVRDFHAFHTAFRYGEEVKRLEKKLEQTEDPTRREKIQKDIDKRKNSREYERFGELVEKHLR